MRVNNGLTPQELEAYGISDVHDIVYNPSYDLLYQEELDPSLTGYERGVLTNLGAVAVDTGIFTGRSPKDKYIVRDDTTRDTFWWADKGKGKNDNKPLSPETWQHLKGLVTRQLSGKRLFVVDAFCGANPDTRLSVRFITEVAWQAHFVKNMFIRPSDEELAGFKPDFIVMNGAKCTNPQWKEQGLNSENFVAFNLTERMQLIGGTWYGGEMKKGMFSMMNYLLPLKGIASMHCSANVGEKGDVAVFFGLSGTGKTTLSTDPKRRLIGDDEHGWDDDGVFNFEGGCYAKTIKLSKEAEPEIYNAIRRDALLENVTVREDGTIDFDDGSKTENTRVSYPIYHIDNIVKPVSKAGHATKVIFLTADAFGVLPPVSRLTADQTQYHFLSGFTAKLAGTERGITEPTPTFSACFGAAFLSLHPTQYAEVLVKRMQAAGAQAYLVNTGWNGTGKRISIKDTRAIIEDVYKRQISLGIIDLVYPAHWQPYIAQDLGQQTDIDIYLDRHVVRQGRYLSLHDEVKNFPLQHWLRSTIIAAGSLLVLFMLLFWIPLDMPLKFTLSWMKGAQTIEATSVKQLADAGVRVGDTLRISGTGMCNIRTSGTWSAKTNSPFLPFDCSQIIWNDARSLPLPESELVNKATALTEAVNRQLHPKPEDESRVSASLRSAIQKSGMVLLDDFGDIVLKTADLCSAKDDCVRLKNALVNLGNSKDWDALVKRANAGKLDGVNVLLRPVSAESLDNLVATSTAPFITHETARAAQSLNSPAPGGFLIVSDEGSDFVDQPWPSASLYDYPPQEQWNAFQKLAQMLMHTPFNAEGIVTKIFTDANGTQHIGLHPIPDRSGLWRYLSTTLLLLTMLGSAIYNGVQAWRRYQRHRTRMMEIQAYYESCLNPQLITPSESLIE